MNLAVVSPFARAEAVSLESECHIFNYPSFGLIFSSHFCGINFSGYNLLMNKRAKKRVKEAIEKKNLERTKAIQEQNAYSAKKLPESRGFTLRPDKKRG